MKPSTLFAVLVLCAAGCKPEATADDTPAPPVAETAARPTPADKASGDSAEDESGHPAATKPNAVEAAEVVSGVSGVYAVLQAGPDKAALVSVKGDQTVHAQGVDGVWYVLATADRIPLSHISKVKRDDMRGGSHFGVELDATGTAALKALTASLLGKRMALVVEGKVLIAPVVEAAIESGRLQVSCGSAAKPCYDAMETLEQQSKVTPAE